MKSEAAKYSGFKSNKMNLKKSPARRSYLRGLLRYEKNNLFARYGMSTVVIVGASGAMKEKER